MWNWVEGRATYERVDLPCCPTIFALTHFECCMIELIELYDAIKMTINQISLIFCARVAN